jgi:hypothetical protein
VQPKKISLRRRNNIVSLSEDAYEKFQKLKMRKRYNPNHTKTGKHRKEKRIGKLSMRETFLKTIEQRKRMRKLKRKEKGKQLRLDFLQKKVHKEREVRE